MRSPDSFIHYIRTGKERERLSNEKRIEIKMNSQDTILLDYELRKSNKEKSAFLEYLKARLEESGYSPKEMQIEERGKGLLKTQNLIVGDPEKAKVVFSAHYDTCAVLPFPNLMSPTNPVIFITYQILVVFVLLIIAGAPALAFGLLFRNGELTVILFEVLLFVFLFHTLFGWKNKHTANDNTSGVIFLTQFLEKIPIELRSLICVVYFDNEEKGLLGSAFFHTKHKKCMKDKLIINVDCVGDGREVVSLANRPARRDSLYPLFVEAMKKASLNFNGEYLCRNMKFMMFGSDQANFKKGIGICALCKSVFGRYVARIHTSSDTICRQENITYLVQAMVEVVKNI